MRTFALGAALLGCAQTPASGITPIQSSGSAGPQGGSIAGAAPAASASPVAGSGPSTGAIPTQAGAGAIPTQAGAGGAAGAGGQAGGGAGSGAGSDCVPDATPAGAATFTGIYQSILCDSCISCHGETVEAGLSFMTRARAYTQLVGGDPGSEAVSGACAASQLKLVRPGDVNGSLLYLKLARTAPCGDEGMPPGPDGAAIITPDMLARVRAWIEAGAPDN